MGHLLSVSGIDEEFYIGVSSVEEGEDDKLRELGFTRRYADYRLPFVSKRPTKKELHALAKKLTDSGIITDQIASL